MLKVKIPPGKKGSSLVRGVNVLSISRSQSGKDVSLNHSNSSFEEDENEDDKGGEEGRKSIEVSKSQEDISKADSDLSKRVTCSSVSEETNGEGNEAEGVREELNRNEKEQKRQGGSGRSEESEKVRNTVMAESQGQKRSKGGKRNPKRQSEGGSRGVSIRKSSSQIVDDNKGEESHNLEVKSRGFRNGRSKIGKINWSHNIFSKGEVSFGRSETIFISFFFTSAKEKESKEKRDRSFVEVKGEVNLWEETVREDRRGCKGRNWKKEVSKPRGGKTSGKEMKSRKKGKMGEVEECLHGASSSGGFVAVAKKELVSNNEENGGTSERSEGSIDAVGEEG